MRAISKFAVALATCTALLAPQAKAEVVRHESAEALINRKTPVYVWQDNAKKPRAVAIAIHGLVMHGGVYDALAKKLATDGIIVIAPDLRGFGRWQGSQNKQGGLNYGKSQRDVGELVEAAKARYPNLPLFCIGESLGAGIAMHVAIDHPGLVDGLILSSPALKHRSFVGPMLSEAPAFLIDMRKKVDLAPYIKKFASDDPRIIAESLADPLVTKRMTTWELVRSINCMRPNLHYAKRIPANIPLLVIQGNKDRMLKSNAVVQLLARAKSKDQTVRWFNDRGHLLLETAYLRPETVDTVSGWLQEHIDDAQLTTQVSISEESTGSTSILAGTYAEQGLASDIIGSTN
jgi:alpha-beta hydrolase superfamily lysophospholipase